MLKRLVDYEYGTGLTDPVEGMTSVEVPDDLVNRYEKAMTEFQEVQKLLLPYVNAQYDAYCFDLRKEAEKLIGRPADQVFRIDNSHCWKSPVPIEICQQILEMAKDHPETRADRYATYAYPNLVKSGQTYSLHVSDR